MKKALSLILVLAMLAGVASALAESGDTGIRKDTLVVALQAEPATLDVYAASHDTTSIGSETVFESLLKYEDGEYKPWLATGYEIVDDTTLIFHLRDDVYFHDGNKMTADDVIFSLCYGAQSNFTSTLFGAIDPENTRAIVSASPLLPPDRSYTVSRDGAMPTRRLKMPSSEQSTYSMQASDSSVSVQLPSGCRQIDSSPALSSCGLSARKSAISSLYSRHSI